MFSFLSLRAKIETLQWRGYGPNRTPAWRLVANLNKTTRLRPSVANSPSMLRAVLNAVRIDVTILAGPTELISKRMRAVVPGSALGEVMTGRLLGLAVQTGGLLVGIRVIPREITDPAQAAALIEGWVPD